MAILKKRTSSKQLPEARGLDRAPLDSVIRNFNDRPSLTGRESGSLTSGGSGARPSLPAGTSTTGGTTRPNISTGSGATVPPITSTVTSPTTSPTLSPSTKPALQTKPPASLTTKTSTVPKTTLAPKTSLTSKTTSPVKPTITNKTSTTPTTKTTSPTSVVKPTVKPNVSNTNSTTNKIVNALTGAAIGAGTKLIFDKITGKPVVKTTTGTTKPTTGGTTRPTTGGTTRPTTGGTTKPTTGGTTKPTIPTKPTTPTKPTAPVTPKSPTSVVKPPVGGSGTADDVYKGTPADESLGLPAGAIDNGDGTYTTVFDDGSSMTYSMEDGSVLYSTDTEGAIDVVKDSTDTTVAENEDETVVAGGDDVTDDADTTVADNTTPEYYQDDEGNYYVMNDDGGYDLAYYADGTQYEDTYTDDSGDTALADNTYTDPDTGAEWTLSDNGEWTTDFNYDDYYASEDYALADNSDYTDNTDYSGYDDYLYAGNDDYTDYDYTDYSDYEYAKRGGLITMMKKGGVPRFEEGGYSDTGEDVQDWQNVSYNYGEYDDPTMTGDDSLYSQSGALNNSYLRDLALDDGEEVVDDTYYGEDDFTPIPGRQYFDDGSYIDTFDDGSTMTYDYDGNLVETTDGYQTTRDDEGNYIVTDGYGNMTVYDPSGSVIPLGGGRVNQRPITNVGGGSRTPTVGNVLGPTGNQSNVIGSDLLDKFTGALGTTAGMAGAGALIASLLGSDFGGGTGNQNQGLDMSKVGLINPRTTDFGIGPTNFVGYDQYGTDQEGYEPNEELLRNLNAPGFNPVREGDYGYEEEPVEEEVPAMASGGLSSMATPVSSYYTFGQPADIMANLGMRPQPPMNPPQAMPQIGQQQPQQAGQKFPQPAQSMMAPPQMAQQMPNQLSQSGMMPASQGMAPPMRKGGLPHVSNVPLTQGRMDFRKGAAVHGEGDGQSDDIPAMLADGEYVIDAETVAQIGNGSTKAGAQALDKFREGIRAHKRSAPINKIPPKTKALTSYLKGAK